MWHVLKRGVILLPFWNSLDFSQFSFTVTASHMVDWHYLNLHRRIMHHVTHLTLTLHGLLCFVTVGAEAQKEAGGEEKPPEEAATEGGEQPPEPAGEQKTEEESPEAKTEEQKEAPAEESKAEEQKEGQAEQQKAEEQKEGEAEPPKAEEQKEGETAEAKPEGEEAKTEEGGTQQKEETATKNWRGALAGLWGNSFDHYPASVHCISDIRSFHFPVRMIVPCIGDIIF